MAEGKWRTRLGAAAELDFANILKWTAENFGERQAGLYRDTLVQAIEELAADPYLVTSRTRDEILPGFRTLHVGRRGRRGRHLLLYRVVQGEVVEITRILHDSMDFQSQTSFPPEANKE